MRYYAFAGNKPIIDGESVKWLIKTLKNYYSDIGDIQIMDSTKTIIRSFSLRNKRVIRHEMMEDMSFPMIDFKDHILVRVDEKFTNNYSNQSDEY